MSKVISTVGVIVCTHNRPELLRACVHSLIRQSRKPNEIIIVRGCRKSVPPDLSESLPCLCVRDCFGENISASRNAGLRESCSEIVLFIDDDAIAEDGWIESMTEGLQSPNVWGVSGIVYDSRIKPPQLEFQNGIIKVTGRQKQIFNKNTSNLPKGWFRNLHGCNCGFWRDEILNIGGFDEFIEFAFDESDLAIRITRAGAKVCHLSQAIVYHSHAPGVHRQDTKLRRNWYAEIKNHLYFGRKHSRAMSRSLVWIVILCRCLKLSFRLMAGTVSGYISARNARESLFEIARGVVAGARAPRPKQKPAKK